MTCIAFYALLCTNKNDKDMTVLIANSNKVILNSLSRTWKPKYKVSTANTSTFQITENKMRWLINELQTIGYNPYALLTF